MRRLLGAGLVTATLMAATLAGQSQTPSSPGGKSGPAPKGEPAKAPTVEGAKRLALDKLKLPPEAVLILCDEKDGLKLLPRAVLMTPEKYKELLEEIARLKRQLKPERTLPRECRLKATVEGDFVQLQADFVIVVESGQPRTSVFLGCRGAQLKEDAKLRQGEGEGEGTVPLLESSASGYAVSIEKPGHYRLTLQFKLPVAFAAGAASRGAERNFELGLPGTPVTTLTVELAQPVREIRWNKTFSQKAVAAGGRQKRFEGILLSDATNLVLSWQEPVSLPDAGPLLTAKGQVIVKLEEQRIVTTAELTLADLRGKTTVWQLWLPFKAEVKIAAPESITATLGPPNSKTQQRTLTVKPTTTDPIKLTVTVQQPRPLGQRLPVGPFAVANAFRQEGTIEVRASPTARSGVRLQYTLGGDTEERELPRDHAPDTRALFRYTNMAVPFKMIGKLPAPGTAPLELEVKAAKGQVETSVEHTLRVRSLDASRGGALQVKVTTKIHVRPLGDPVDHLDVQLPRVRPDLPGILAGLNPFAFPDGAPWGLAAAGAYAPHEPNWVAEGADMRSPDKNNTRKVRVSLSKEPTVVLTGTYTLPAGTQRVRLNLPRPLAIKEGRSKVILESDDGLELLIQDLGPETPAPARHKYTYEVDTAPASVEMAWRPYRPEFPVTVVADVTFRERDAHVRQQLTFQFPERQASGPGAYVVRLSVPAAVGSLKVAEGCKWEKPNRDQRQGLAWTRPLPGMSREPLVLEYDFALPATRAADDGRKKAKGKKDADEGEARPFEVPLPWAEDATKVRCKVRLWSEPGTLPSLAAPDPAKAPWTDRGTEVVPKLGLPARVLVAEGAKAPLLLRLERSPALLAGVVVDRALIQVTVDDDGLEHYRARFILNKVQGTTVEVRLPTAGAFHSLAVKVNGAKASLGLPRDDGRVVPVSLPASSLGQPVDLEVSYQLPRNQPEAEGLWKTVLHPPEIVGNVFLGRVRWQVTVPDSWVPIVAGADAHPEQTWGWPGWLPAPEPSSDAAQLEQWVSGKPGGEAVLPSLVCSRTSLEPLRLLRMPRQAWFLLCSGVLLLVGLGLYFAPLSHYTFWLTLGALGVGVVAAGVVWPSVLPAILYGCEPGALVLVLVLGVQWMLHQRYRRQVVFLPGFKRLKPGSSLVRGNRGRDPSTVDAPAAQVASGGTGSSAGQGK